MTQERCIDHIDFCDEICPDCGKQVDQFGNTEDQFDNCSFPCCGCDGNRLCMAKNGPSERSCRQNVEGMWSGKTLKQRKAVMSLMSDIAKEGIGNVKAGDGEDTIRPNSN